METLRNLPKEEVLRMVGEDAKKVIHKLAEEVTARFGVRDRKEVPQPYYIAVMSHALGIVCNTKGDKPDSAEVVSMAETVFENGPKFLAALAWVISGKMVDLTAGSSGAAGPEDQTNR